MTVSGEIRQLDIRRDLDGLSELLQTAFSGDLAARGSDLREELGQLRRLIPLVALLGRLSPSFRHVFDGFVWEDRGRIVASVMVKPQGNDMTRWYIDGVATHADYRRQGLARRLVTQAMEHARAHGAEVCTLDVRAENLPAYALYLSLGFVHYDGITEFKLEKLPAVQATSAKGYTLRPMTLGEWKPRYELIVRETPPEVQSFLPVSQARYRISAVQRMMVPLLMRLQRVETLRWAAERDGEIVGYAGLFAQRRAKTNHELKLLIAPDHRTALAEPLLTLALESLQRYSPQTVLVRVRTAYEDLITLLKRYGFIMIESSHRLGIKLGSGGHPPGSL